MPPRSGMLTLIGRVRSMTSAGTADATLDGVSYFSDDQLQSLLDTTQRTHRRVALIPCPAFVDGAQVYIDYAIPAEIPYAFETDATTDAWVVRDSVGTAVDAADYTVNYAAGRVSFTSDTGGRMYTLDCRSYDLHRAAAKVWRQKAAFAAPDANWQTDNHRLEAADIFAHYMSMAALHDRLAGPSVARMVRGDEA